MSTMETIQELGRVTAKADFLTAVDAEETAARRHESTFHSLHEAYAIILEEVDELWEITRLKKRNRKPEDIRKELVQIAAMAVKAALSIDNFVGGDV